jgi:AraC-like DNA-binding protein
VHAGLPSRHITFVASLGDPVDVGVMHDPTAPRTRYTALVGGLHTAPAAIHHDGSEHGVQLEITPQGTRALFGLPAAEIAARVVPLDTALGRLATELVDRLHAADTWSQRFAILDQILLRAISDVAEPPREVMWAWDRLARTAGAVAIADLAREVGWSRRHLSERFGREIGLPPKTMARVMRFQRARREFFACASVPANSQFRINASRNRHTASSACAGGRITSRSRPTIRSGDGPPSF